MSKTILIVDDEESICELLQLELELEGYQCITAMDGITAVELFEEKSPDLVLLDLMLPGMNGMEVCQKITASSDVPVIMLTAKADVDNKIDGLQIGADDYITKPFNTRELLARIKALIRRYDNIHHTQNKKLQNLDLIINPDSKTAMIENKQIKLTMTEFDILTLLMSNMDKVFSREMILDQLGMTDFQEDTRSIDMHIQRLRKKLAKYTDIKYIETVFGIGYKMRNLNETPI